MSTRSKSQENPANVPTSTTGAQVSSTNVTAISSNDKSVQVPSKEETSLTDRLQGLFLQSKKQPSNQSRPEPEGVKFTQPVPVIKEKIGQTVKEPIEPDKPISDIRQEPNGLPKGFELCTLEIDDYKTMEELNHFLNENQFGEDNDMYRTDYSPDFLRWALKPPGWVKDWHVGIRVTKSKKLVGFISAIPANVSVSKKYRHSTAEIKFMIVHKKLQGKRMKLVLWREINRRINLTGKFKVAYTTAVLDPERKPIVMQTYWHRQLNPKKLIEVKYSHLTERMTLQRMEKFYKLPEYPKLTGFRQMGNKDVKNVHKLLHDYLSKFDLAPFYSMEEIEHWFLPRENVVRSFVVEDQSTHDIVAFSSFFSLPATVLHHPTYKYFDHAFSFYNVGSERVSLKEMIQDTLVIAKELDYDVFSMPDLTDNKDSLEDLKFVFGGDKLGASVYYYVLAFHCEGPELKREQVGLVLR